MTIALEVGVRREHSAWETLSSPEWLSAVQTRVEQVAAADSSTRRNAPVALLAIKCALLLLQDTMSDDTLPPNIVPTADGGLQLEWHHNGVDLEVYVEAVGTVSAWCREGSREWEDDYYSTARIAKELSRLTSSPAR